METNPDKIKFIEQFILVFMVDCATRQNQFSSDYSRTPEYWRDQWAKQGLREAHLAWDAIQSMRMNNYKL